ncbi:hypothetical protein HK100_007949 [Physocladia obscura]|uniref:Uncharacterized protein n=1 Tax=Physocladia obscura TaxID=109957 RepID=A0AAD5SNT7_9FUNG|nr:hypothetical protein HK100_007949 [Physocladia obscura]
MKQSDESFIISGKAFIICSPALSGRYGVGPRGIQLPDPLPIFPPSNPFPPTSDDFWQSERDRLWKELSSAFRATWTWPNTGEPRMKDNFVSSPILKNSILGQRVPVTPPPATFKCTRLDVILEESSNTNNDLRAIHMAAYDNFCVLVFRVLKVEHQFIGNDGIPGRNLYTVARDGNWGVENLNP